MGGIQLWQPTLFCSSCRAKAGDMRNRFHLPLFAGLLLWASAAMAVPKPHVIVFGKWTPVKWLAGSGESKPLDLKIRGLYVDTRLKEYTTGAPHEVTDRLFVVRRVFRLNDTLPDETSPTPRMAVGASGWLLVDRLTGRVSQINLPEFDFVLFDGQLVPRLHRVLRSFGRREKAVRDRRTTGTPQADSEEAAGRARRRGRAPFRNVRPPAGSDSPRA